MQKQNSSLIKTHLKTQQYIIQTGLASFHKTVGVFECKDPSYRLYNDLVNN
jgi:hypothetical protein